MKKFLLLCVAASIGIASYAQTAMVKGDVKTTKVNPKQEMTKVDEVPLKATPMTKTDKVIPPVSPDRETTIVNIVDIGSAANVYTYGYNNGSSTILWYEKDINTVAHIHRMGGDVGPPGQYSGDLCYDVSTDGGMTWTNQIKIYESNTSGGQYNIDAARYPQGGIYNPAGNTDPNNAYVAYFAALLDGTNGGTWGGYGYGTASIADPEDTTKHWLSSDLDNGFYQGISTAFTVNAHTEAWEADASLLDSYTEYLGDIIFMQGQWNDETTDYDYTEFLVGAECNYARYLKMAFEPTYGDIGYVFWNNYDGSIPGMDEWSYPLLLQTTDGGENWSDELISVKIFGPDGIDAVKNYLTDEQLEQLFEPPIPDRDDIAYSTPYFNSDIAVDAFGNPHVVTSVFLCANDPGYIIIEPETFGTFDLYTIDPNNMDDWYGVFLGRLKTYEGLFQPDDYNEFNRLQVSSNHDGSMLFYSWNDTRLEGVDQNTSPDIYARGFDLVINMITTGAAEEGATNVTEFSEGMWQSYLHILSPYVIEGEGTWTMPMTYCAMNPENIIEPVQFKYIQDFSYAASDFTTPTGNPPFVSLGMGENMTESTLSVSQNHPNPANTKTDITVTLERAANVNVVVTTLTGQRVLEMDEGFVKAGKRIITINTSDLSNGVYFYTVYAGNEKVTNKMIVE